MKIGIFIAVLSLFLISAFCLDRPDRDAAEDVNNLITSLFDRKQKGEEVNLNIAIREFVDLANEYKDPELPVDNPLGFWQWIPIYHTSVLPGTVGNFSSSCFQTNTFTVKIDDHHETTYEITSSDPVSDTCMDYYLIATLEDARVLKVKAAGTITRKWIYRDLRGALEWDVQTNGFRIFRFLNDPEKTLQSLAQTAALFEPIIEGPGVAEEFAELNVQFLRNYANLTLDKRKTEVVTINESQIHSGDFFGITRLDGLDPMIIWGYGGATGHTAVALWFGDELYICESTVNSDYWPTNGIQRTPYATWIKQAQNASYNYVWVPLAANVSSTFNATAAAEFFFSVEGTPYGFHNFLFGWLDTSNDNYPCLPPAYDNCLSSQIVQVLSGLVAAIDQPLAYRFFIQAFNKRLGTNYNDTAEIYQYSQVNEGIPFDVLYTIPEEDAWVYNDGYSMVCDVFVCEIWKSAGLFGNLANVINCTEQTPFDVYSMSMFDTEWSPPQNCQDADPGLNYCQLGGKYRLLLDKFGTREPYPLMDQTCPSLAPSYDRPSNC